jgi:hypothetical protein
MTAAFDAWLDALLARHTATLRRPEFLRAIRALSARYVETRAALPARSPLDSAGKRAAFAAYYAPLHFLTTMAIVRSLELDRRPIRRIVDLGCGTGVAGAAWATALGSKGVELEGVDTHGWALAEAALTWRALGVRGRARREDLVRTVEALARQRHHDRSLAVVAGWAVNELDAGRRERLRRGLMDLDAAVLIVEPIARRFLPWWDGWSQAIISAGGRADEWRFRIPLPPALADLDEAAGFARDGLTARSLLR